jgi:hypothetical protein
MRVFCWFLFFLNTCILLLLVCVSEIRYFVTLRLSSDFSTLRTSLNFHTLRLYWNFEILRLYWNFETLRLSWDFRTLCLSWDFRTLCLSWDFGTLRLSWDFGTLRLSSNFGTLYSSKSKQIANFIMQVWIRLCAMYNNKTNNSKIYFAQYTQTRNKRALKLINCGVFWCGGRDSVEWV